MHIRWVRGWPVTICGFTVVYGKQSRSAPEVAPGGHPDGKNARTSRLMVWCGGRERRQCTCARIKAVRARRNTPPTQHAHCRTLVCGFVHGAPPQRVVSGPAWPLLTAQLAHHADRRGRESCSTRRDVNSRDSLHCVPARHTVTGRRRTSVETSDRCQMPAVALACSAKQAGALKRKQQARSQRQWAAAPALIAPPVHLPCFPGSRGFEVLKHLACWKCHRVAVGPLLTGMASWSPGRRAVTAPQPGAGVGAVRSSRKFASGAVVSQTTEDFWKPQIILAEKRTWLEESGADGTT